MNVLEEKKARFERMISDKELQFDKKYGTFDCFSRIRCQSCVLFRDYGGEIPGHCTRFEIANEYEELSL